MSGIKHIQLTGTSMLESVDMDFYDKGLKQDEEYSGKMIELVAVSECDGFCHYIIPPAMWKDNVEEGREVKDGEYQYWTYASWNGPAIWDSVRDSIAHHVEYVEDMVEKGEREDDDYLE
jgi:hypothetical protein